GPETKRKSTHCCFSQRPDTGVHDTCFRWVGVPRRSEAHCWLKYAMADVLDEIAVALRDLSDGGVPNEDPLLGQLMPALRQLPKEKYVQRGHLLLRSLAAQDPVSCSSKTPKNTWLQYVQEQRLGGRASLAEIGAKWHALPEAEVAAVEARRQLRQQRQPPAQVRPSDSRPAWPHCGDQFYPISLENLVGVNQRVQGLSRQWASAVGDGVVRPCARIHAPVKKLCSAFMERGCCRGKCPAAEFGRLMHWQRFLRDWCRLVVLRNFKWDSTWDQLGFMYVGAREDGARGSDDPEPGHIVVCLDADMSDFQAALVMHGHGPPAIGDIIDLNLRFDTLTDHRTFPRAMVAAEARNDDELVTLQINYTQVGLLRYRVDGLEDVAAKTAEDSAARARDRELRKAEKMARGEDVVNDKRRRKGCAAGAMKKRKGGKLAAGKEAKGDGAPDGDAEDGELESSGGEDAEENGSSNSGDDYDDVGGGGEEEAAGGHADAGGAGGAGVHADGGGGGGAGGGGGGLPAYMFDEETGRVTLPDGTAVGRISMIKVGTTQEAVSIYCNWHGCKMMKRVIAAPPCQPLIEWLVAGTATPKRRGAADVRMHEASFPAAG
ncbi:unnamed protein product, partial [Prorocentrum cordatum]